MLSEFISGMSSNMSLKTQHDVTEIAKFPFPNSRYKFIFLFYSKISKSEIFPNTPYKSIFLRPYFCNSKMSRSEMFLKFFK